MTSDNPISEFLTDSHLPKPLKHAPGVRIFFEDQDILVVEKPAGLLSVPTEKREQKTLFGILKRYLMIKHRQKAFTQPVQRLDRGTSGVMVWPKTNVAWQDLKEQFEFHSIQRTYVGIVKGRMENSSGTIRNFLKTDHRFNQIVFKNEGNGAQEAITHYKVLRHGDDFSFVEFKLETGRKNQIRAQVADLGHPILGDERYQPKLAVHKLWKFNRLALHASRLEFNHPGRRKLISFQSKLPKEFTNLLFDSALP